MSDAPQPDPVVCPGCNLVFRPRALPAGDSTITVAPVQGGAPLPPTQIMPPGSLGRFEVRRSLGEGGFGTVYEAFDLALKRAVALKVSRHAGPRRAGRFLREAQAAAALTHPNIVAVFDFGAEGPHHYIATAFVPGQTLAEAITTRGPFPPRQAAEVVRKLAEALAYAHRQGVIHRDVKPSNVMLREDGEPLLMDFGLATRPDEEDEAATTGQFVGTPAYAAPEQWRGEATAASDQYSLGCLLFELLTGHAPFSAEGTDHYGVLHAQAPIPALPSAPRDLEAIARKCLQKGPQRRYPGCQELADDLACWLRGEPTTARPLGPLGWLWRWAGRAPAAAALLGALILLLLGGTAAGWGLAGWALGEKRRADTEAELKQREAGLKVKEAIAARKAEEEARASEGLARQRQQAADFQAMRAEQALDATRLGVAVRAWIRHDLAAAEQALREGRPEFRHDWESRFVRSLCRRTALPLLGHTGAVTAAVFSPDGRRVATASSDRTACLWDGRSGRPLLTLRGHTAAVNAVAFSPDGAQLATGSSDKTVRVWDTRKGRESFAITGHTAPVWGVAFSPDGTRLVSCAGLPTDVRTPGEVKVWDVRSGLEKLELEGHTAAATAVAFSPDGARIAATGHDGTARVWGARSGLLEHTLKGHSDTVSAVAFSPDGRHIATAGWDRTVRLWDARGQHLATLRGHAGELTSVNFSPDGRFLVSAGRDGAARLWGASTGAQASALRGHRGPVLGVTFSPDGRFMATAGDDRAARLWDTNASPFAALRGHTNLVRALAFSPDCRLVASAGFDETVRVWVARTRQELFTFRVPSRAHAVAFSPDGERIASAGADGAAHVWGARSGRPLLTLKGHALPVTAVAFSPDGKLLASAGRDQTARLWDAHTGRALRTLDGHADWVNALSFSPDGKRLATASGKPLARGKAGQVKLWDVRTGLVARSFSGHTGSATGVAFSPDGKLLASSSEDGTARVWCARSGRLRFSLRGRKGPAWAVAFSPDGARIVTGAGDSFHPRRPGELTFWDARTGEPRLSLQVSAGVVTCLAFAPDGRSVATGGTRDVLLWEPGRESLLFTGHGARVTGLAFSRDGKRLVTKDARGNRLDFDAATGRTLPPDNTPPPADVLRASQPGGALAAAAWNNDVLVETPPPLNRRLWALAGRDWHTAQARECERDAQWPAAAFHLERLYRSTPGARSRLLDALKRAGDSPLTRSVRRGAQATDAARAASAVARPGLLVLPLLAPSRATHAGSR